MYNKLQQAAYMISSIETLHYQAYMLIKLRPTINSDNKVANRFDTRQAIIIQLIHMSMRMKFGTFYIAHKTCINSRINCHV
jgi:hypothetical protein